MPFGYYPQPLLRGLGAHSGPAAGGTLVLATGEGFSALEGLAPQLATAAGLEPTTPLAAAPACRFGARVGPAAVLNDSALMCTAPYGAGGVRVVGEFDKLEFIAASLKQSLPWVLRTWAHRCTLMHIAALLPPSGG